MGWPDLPVPPTFLFCLEMEQPDPWGHFKHIGIDVLRVLHGEQTFTHHAATWAGDRLTFVVRVADLYEKKQGALEFVTMETRVTNQGDDRVADLRSVLVVRNG
jgi:acyl dehydratase